MFFEAAGQAELFAVRATNKSFALSVCRRLTAVLTDITLTHIGSDASAERRRAAALRCLAAIVASQAIDDRTTGLLFGCLYEKRADIRRYAAAALTRCSIPPVLRPCDGILVDVLGPALADTEEQVSSDIAKVLPRLVERGNKAGVSLGLRYIQHLNSWVRQSAVAVLTGLSEKGDKIVVRALANLVCQDTDWRCRAAAARALPSIAERGNSVATVALQAALTDEESRVRQVASGSLAHVGALPSMPFLAIKAANYRMPVHRRSKRKASPTFTLASDAESRGGKCRSRV